MKTKQDILKMIEIMLETANNLRNNEDTKDSTQWINGYEHALKFLKDFIYK